MVSPLVYPLSIFILDLFFAAAGIDLKSIGALPELEILKNLANSCSKIDPAKIFFAPPPLRSFPDLAISGPFFCNCSANFLPSSV